MKSIERVAAALKHQEADRVPVYPLMNGITRRLVGASYKRWATDATVTAEAYLQVTEKLGLDVICTLTDLSVEAADFGQKLVWFENEAACPDHTDRRIKTVDEYRTIEYVNPRTSARMSEHVRLCDMLVKAKGCDVPVVAFVFGPLGILSMLRGQEEMFVDLYENPSAVKAALEVINATLTEYCDAIIETGAHAIMLDTLFASQTIMSKAMWMEFEGHLVRKLAKHIHDRGCMVMIHNCGGGIY
ncbi:MAG: uroporphyrinogen decarboxylase, partial [Planctomycetaceae bacterium]